ncbi:MAG TPA: polyketide synthase [Hyphomicrobiaceae bacterium]|nr:polyketide synthase [Hyphomicrobiaceae bacterium]
MVDPVVVGPSDTPPVRWRISEEGIATIHMCDVSGRNALSEAFVDALSTAIAAVGDDLSARVTILTGTREVFCSGASKAVLRRLIDGTILPSEIRLPTQILSSKIPIIAAMEGHAVGGGFAVGLSADIVIMANESRYGCNFMDLGLTPGMGTTRLLEHVLSEAVAHELLYSCELRRGSKFVGCSGVNYVLPRKEVLPKATEIALRIADKPRSALVLLKNTLAASRRQLVENALVSEKQMHELIIARPETRQMIEDEYFE